MTSLAAIFFVLLFCGVLGGTINHYLSAEEPDKALSGWQHMVIGVGAAFMVPLFLNMISSSLVSEIMDSAAAGNTSAKLFVLAGFCLVAAVSSRAFISSLSERVMREVREAKQTAQAAHEDAAEAKAAVEPLVEGEVPPPETAEPTAVRSRSAMLQAGPLSEAEKKVMQAMRNSTYLIRALNGIARQAELEVFETQRALEGLLGRGYVDERKSDKAGSKWLLTPEGRSLAEAL